MFKVEQANSQLGARKLGGWKRYPRTPERQEAAKVQEIADRQERGKKHFTRGTSTDIRNALDKNDVYIFEDESGRPVVFVLAFGDSDQIDMTKVLGCETSGAVEPQYLDAVKVLAQTDKDFEMKMTEAAQKVANQEKLENVNDKALVQTFLPPPQNIDDDPLIKVPTGGIGYGIASATSSFYNRAMAGANQQTTQNQQRQQRQQREKPEVQENTPTDPLDPNAPLDPALVFQEASLVALVRSNIPLNRDQISLILRSIAIGTVYEDNNGRSISVTMAMTPEAMKQVEAFIKDPRNQGFVQENNLNLLMESPNCKKLDAALKRHQEKKPAEENEERTEDETQQQPKPKQPQQQRTEQPQAAEEAEEEIEVDPAQQEQLFEEFGNDLGEQINQAQNQNNGILPEPPQPKPKPPLAKRYKRFKVNGRIIIKQGGKIV